MSTASHEKMKTSIKEKKFYEKRKTTIRYPGSR